MLNDTKVYNIYLVKCMVFLTLLHVIAKCTWYLEIGTVYFVLKSIYVLVFLSSSN